MPDIVNDYMQKINEITGNDYKPFNYYGDSNDAFEHDFYSIFNSLSENLALRVNPLV